MILNEYAAKVLPRFVKERMDYKDIKKLNELDDIAQRNYTMRLVSMVSSAANLIALLTIQGNLLLALIPITLLMTFILHWNFKDAIRNLNDEILSVIYRTGSSKEMVEEIIKK